MSDTASGIPTTSAFLNSLGSSILNGGSTAKKKETISDIADLGSAIGSQILGVNGANNTTNDRLSPLISDDSSASSLRDAISGAFVGGSDLGQTAQDLASLGMTLDQMAKLAQTALTTTSTTARDSALTSYSNLYASLNQSAAAIDGAAGNTASLGLSTPGDWSDSDVAAGTAAIASDMTAVVKAHTVVQQMIQSVSATLQQSYLLVG